MTKRLLRTWNTATLHPQHLKHPSPMTTAAPRCDLVKRIEWNFGILGKRLGNKWPVSCIFATTHFCTRWPIEFLILCILSNDTFRSVAWLCRLLCFVRTNKESLGGTKAQLVRDTHANNYNLGTNEGRSKSNSRLRNEQETRTQACVMIEIDLINDNEWPSATRTQIRSKVNRL